MLERTCKLLNRFGIFFFVFHKIETPKQLSNIIETARPVKCEENVARKRPFTTPPWVYCNAIFIV